MNPFTTILLLVIALVPHLVSAEFPNPNKLEQLQALPADTQGISLASWGGKEDLAASLRYLRNFKKLRSLNLSQANIENAELAFLADLPKLESLTFRGRRGYGNNRVDDEGIASLLACPNLKHLKLGALGLTDKACKTLGKLNQLESLALDANLITDEGLAHLRGLRHLKELNLRGNTKINGNGIRHLANLPALREVMLPHTFRALDSHLQHIGELRQLRKLHLGGNTEPGITDTGMAALRHLTQLESLQIELCDGITDAGYSHLSARDKLTELRLRRITRMTRESVSVIAGLSQLRLLKITDAHKLSAADLDPLAKLGKLEELTLWNVGRGRGDFAFCSKLTALRTLLTTEDITPARLASIAQAGNLRSLTFNSKAFPPSSQRALATMTTLEHLHMSIPVLTDEAVTMLAGLRELRTLRLLGQGFARNPKALKTLAQQLPNCEVRTRDGVVAP
jgi:Leucine-rich repeat (LRR) protein